VWKSAAFLLDLSLRVPDLPGLPGKKQMGHEQRCDLVLSGLRKNEKFLAAR
jgi:hypothetical protein